MNRCRRRGAASKSRETSKIKSAAEIPMARPKFDKAQGTTLYEMAAARQAQLMAPGRPSPKSASSTDDSVRVMLSPDGRMTTEASADEDVDLSGASTTAHPILDTIFLALPLSSLHFTLSVLTVHQYAQELKFAPIIRNTVLVALPTLVLLVHLLHGHLIALPMTSFPVAVRHAMSLARQLLFVVAANVAGCYLIYLTNDRGYYAVLKNAPSVGTIWVWSVLELGLAPALLGVAGPGLFAWWNRYGIF